MLDLLIPSAPGIYRCAIRSGACRYLPVVTTGYTHRQESSYLQFKLCRQISHLWSVVLSAPLVCLTHFRFSWSVSLCTHAWGSRLSSEWALTYNRRVDWSSTWPRTLLNHSWQLPVWLFVCVLTAAETKPQRFQTDVRQGTRSFKQPALEPNSARLKSVVVWWWICHFYTYKLAKKIINPAHLKRHTSMKSSRVLNVCDWIGFVSQKHTIFGIRSVNTNRSICVLGKIKTSPILACQSTTVQKQEF